MIISFKQAEQITDALNASVKQGYRKDYDLLVFFKLFASIKLKYRNYFGSIPPSPLWFDNYVINLMDRIWKDYEICYTDPVYLLSKAWIYKIRQIKR